MDLKTLKDQIDKDFPVARRKIEMTPLHKDAVLLVSTVSTPIRMRHLALILCGDAPNAPGWVDKVCELAEALNELQEADVLNCNAMGWTKATQESTHAG